MSLGGGPSGPTQAELNAQRKRQEQLEQQQEESRREADRQRQLRLSERRASSRGLRGRQSLISGSELGEKDKLG